MHFIHLNINSFLPKIDEIRCVAKLTNATVIGLSETKLGNTVLSGELEIEGYDLVRSDRSRRVRGVACFVKNSISYNRKPNFCINMESTFIEIFLPAIIVIIFWDFLMFYQILLSPQVKRYTIITYKHGIYEFPHELPNDLRNCLNFIEWYPSAQSSCQNEDFVNTCIKLSKKGN